MFMFFNIRLELHFNFIVEIKDSRVLVVEFVNTFSIKFNIFEQKKPKNKKL